MLTPEQNKFLKRYVISKGPSIKANSLDTMKRDERTQKIKWVLDTIRNGDKRWEERISGTEGKTGKADILKEKDARDRLVNYGWMDRDAKAFEGMLAEAKPFMTPEDVADCQGVIKRLGQRAADGRLGMRHGVELDFKHALDSEWPAMARTALDQSLSRKEMLQKIESIEAEMEAMRLALKLSGDKPSKVNAFDKVLQKLRDKYEERVPAYTAGDPIEVPYTKGEVPELKYSDKVCLEIYDMAGRDWFKLKKMYKSKSFIDDVAKKLGARPKDGDEVMWQLWSFRKKVVDGLIGEATAKFKVAGKGTGWVAVGSTNLESDYDLSVMEHGEIGDDFEVVDWFNKQFQSRYKQQPGIMFDTNLYASAKPRARMSDNPETASEKAMAAMARSGQDVGALMKQRRFMSWEEYEDMMNDVLDEMEATGAEREIVNATRTQFEEADARYQESQLKIANKSLDILAKMEVDLGNELKTLKGTEKDASENELARIRAVQKDLADIADKAENAKGSAQAQLLLDLASEMDKHEDILLAVNNQIYVDAIKESRDLETAAAKIATELESLQEQVQKLSSGQEEGVPDSEELVAKKEELRKKQVEFDGKAARSKDLFTDAVFFANEAYHSEGPFKHVVEATQSVEGDVERDYIKMHSEDEWEKLGTEGQNKLIDTERAKRRDDLSLHACLQSFNEQLGDFVKDLHHHAAAKDEDLPGTGFFRSSKYLDRLIDSVDLLDKKASGGVGVSLPGKIKSPQEVRATLGKGLLALRKGKIRIEKEGASETEQAEQMEAFAIGQIRDLFGVTTLHDLGKMFKSYGSKVNAKLRSQVAVEMQALQTGTFFS